MTEAFSAINASDEEGCFWVMAQNKLLPWEAVRGDDTGQCYGTEEDMISKRGQGNNHRYLISCFLCGKEQKFNDRLQFWPRKLLLFDFQWVTASLLPSNPVSSPVRVAGASRESRLNLVGAADPATSTNGSTMTEILFGSKVWIVEVGSLKPLTHFPCRDLFGPVVFPLSVKSCK